MTAFLVAANMIVAVLCYRFMGAAGAVGAIVGSAIYWQFLA